MLSGHETRTPGFVWVMATHSITPGNNMLSGRLGLQAWFWVMAAHSIRPGNTMLSGHETRTPGFVLGDGSSLDHPRKQLFVDPVIRIRLRGLFG